MELFIYKNKSTLLRTRLLSNCKVPHTAASRLYACGGVLQQYSLNRILCWSVSVSDTCYSLWMPAYTLSPEVTWQHHIN